MYGRAVLLILTLMGMGTLGVAQTQPKTCTPPPSRQPTQPLSEEEQQERSRWAEYRLKLQAYAKLLPKEPDKQLQMPVQGARAKQITNTFGALRDGRRKHEGQDIFAAKGTPIYSATSGFVWRISYGVRGGLYVFVIGPGGRRYYYAHLDRYAQNLYEGMPVTTSTLLGYVGNTGNAQTTPPHLHFGVYVGSRQTCDRKIINPLPLLVDRDWRKVKDSRGETD